MKDSPRVEQSGTTVLYTVNCKILEEGKNYVKGHVNYSRIEKHTHTKKNDCPPRSFLVGIHECNKPSSTLSEHICC